MSGELHDCLEMQLMLELVLGRSILMVFSYGDYEPQANKAKDSIFFRHIFRYIHMLWQAIIERY